MNTEKQREYMKAWRADHPNYNRQWRASHPHASRQHHLTWRRSNRDAAIAAYGGMCACCREAEAIFLDIDHIGGETPEGSTKLHSTKLYSWLKKHHYPTGFRALCRNCNWALHHGPCPHQDK